MAAPGFTHESVGARDLEEAARFYEELFGMEELPAPDFPFPVRWLRVGDLQLHLFQSEEPAPAAYHFGLDVDDLEIVYTKASERGATVGEGYFASVYELPDGAAQLYLRDPSGNLVEVNCPAAANLDRSVIPDIRQVPARSAQSRSARLYPE